MLINAGQTFFDELSQWRSSMLKQSFIMQRITFCDKRCTLVHLTHWCIGNCSSTENPYSAVILTTSFPSNHKGPGGNTRIMSEDILNILQVTHTNPDIQLSPIMYNEALVKILNPMPREQSHGYQLVVRYTVCLSIILQVITCISLPSNPTKTIETCD